MNKVAISSLVLSVSLSAKIISLASTIELQDSVIVSAPDVVV